ncbi:MAG: dTDP-glucose 4,6-dehydratase [Gammaproteobacteria bacterium]
MRRLLVTGGAGFIGANFVRHWLREHPDDRLVVLDALTYAGNFASLAFAASQPQFRFVHGDICDGPLVETLLREERLDTIVHFAAESHVDRSIVAPGAFIQTNVVGTHSLLEAARRVWLGETPVAGHRFHHVSTDEVYGSLGEHDPPFTESSVYAPNSPYSASKAGSDHLVRAYSRTYGLACTLSNCSNNYGPFQFPEKLIPLMIVNILQGKALPVYGDGRNVRDWLHVSDHCHAIDRILGRGAPGEFYNVGGNAEVQNLSLIHMLCELVGRLFQQKPALKARFPECPASQGKPAATLIRMVADRPGHDRRYAIDCAKIERDLAFSPSVKLEAGLESTVAWFLDNEAWWRSVMDGSYKKWLDEHYGTERGDRVG